MIGERVAVSRKRVGRFLEWLGGVHPEMDRPAECSLDELMQLADEFEHGRLARHRGLRESWRVGFIDHLYERASDSEGD